MIILAATPIGNISDASPRLRETLATATVIAAEDTRTTRHLLDILGVHTEARFVSMHDHNEGARVEELLAAARTADVVVVSDAGYPTVSDPGFDLVAGARRAGVPVTVIPGPSAVLAALAVSGLPTDRFSFEGFVPRREGDRRRLWRELSREPRTHVLFESPHRLAATLREMAGVYGEGRPASVSRELTKRFEHTERGTLGELAAWADDGVRGEVVIVVGGAPAAAARAEDHLDEVLALVSDGARLKDACRTVADRTGLRPHELYELALVARK